MIASFFCGAESFYRRETTTPSISLDRKSAYIFIFIGFVRAPCTLAASTSICLNAGQYYKQIEL